MLMLYGGRSLAPEKRALFGRRSSSAHPAERSITCAGQPVAQAAAYPGLDEGDEMLDRGFAPEVEKIIAHAQDSVKPRSFPPPCPNGSTKPPANI